MRSVASIGGVIGTMVNGGRSSRGDSAACSIGAAVGVACIDTRRTPPMSPPVVADRFVGRGALCPITRRDYLDRGGVPTYGPGDAGGLRGQSPLTASAPLCLRRRAGAGRSRTRLR